MNNHQEHEYVDLGLPSGTLWATCNIGADRPEDYGDYFAWGEVEPMPVHIGRDDWEIYKYSQGSHTMMTKYVNKAEYGFKDNLVKLLPEDDAATVNWGKGWRMPTVEEMEELTKKCKWEWLVYGFSLKGPNGNGLFLPASGFRRKCDYSIRDKYNAESLDEEGYYWSCSLDRGSPYMARTIQFRGHFDYIGKYWVSNNMRFKGLSVRAVRSAE